MSAIVLVSICVKDIPERIETANKAKDVRDEIMANVERRREAQVDGPIPMDIGNQGEEECSYCVPGFQQGGTAEHPYAAEEHKWIHPKGVHRMGKDIPSGSGPGASVIGKGRIHGW